jgi:hypothetical protein
MGHYIAAYDSKGMERSGIGYEVWNPNVKLVYSALGQREIGKNDWSGDKRDVMFSHSEILAAKKRINEEEFFYTVQNEEMHPLIRMLTQMQQPEINVEKEKEKLERFLNACLTIAAIEGNVKICFG